jgi:hypothetical protein
MNKSCNSSAISAGGLPDRAVAISRLAISNSSHSIAKDAALRCKTERVGSDSQ